MTDAKPTPDELVVRAQEFVALLAAGRHDDARRDFDDAMTAAMPAAALAGLWQSLLAGLGDYDKVIHASAQTHGEHTLTVVTCKFLKQPIGLRVVFDGRGRIGGLQVVPPEAGVVEPPPRPQTPKGPFPYEARDVTFTNPTDGSTIAGTLTFPSGGGRYPAALMITGSGSQDRDETIFDHKPFLVIADHLARRGIAVLRTDDRGIGGSTGDANSATISTHVTDAHAGLAFLRAQPEIDPAHVGIIGHSEGGIIAAISASEDPAVSFIVSLGGSGLPGSELSAMQVGALLEAKGHSADEVAAVVAIQRSVLATIASGAEGETLRAAIRQALVSAEDLALEGERMTDEQIDARATAEMGMTGSPWFRSFVTLDPRDFWKSVRCRVLALNGELDLQVPADANLAAIDSALRAAGNDKATIRKLRGLNHLFQNAKTGQVEEYEQIEETFDNATLDAIAEWLAEEHTSPSH